ncbi:MAG: antA/AntB antirepressor family protein [Acidithiobacillus caldus]|uniref:antA/AntB antirepressor family protein n=1 Tax=Acidithiobacillus caldus TaxID=33059 RepID=UPI0028157138|nr:antA/AntB antirepressor family protein [Acidithiobacillus caldus]WMT47852.1 MAG: antA/AntB antirepressor family protein [Acidithiobacillus caldus]
MEDLFPVVRREIGGEEVFVVNARDLHRFLGVGKDFSNWIKNRIQVFGLDESKDFVRERNLIFTSSGHQKARRQYVFDYLLTPSSAILVAAQERSARPLVIKKLVAAFGEADALWDAIKNIEIPETIEEEMYIYAIKNPDTGNIKIGISKDPEARLKQLRVGNDADLRLVLVEKIEAPNRFQDERLAHLKNQYLRIRGEWFRSGARLTTKNKEPV